MSDPMTFAPRPGRLKLTDTVCLKDVFYHVAESSDVLSSLTREGLPKHWRAHIVVPAVDPSVFCTVAESWRTLAGGSASTHVFSTPDPAETKNAGRSNETSGRVQAESEFDSMVLRQIERKGYAAPGQTAANDDLARPMLAHTHGRRMKVKGVWTLDTSDGSAHRMPYPLYVQPKRNGVRNLTDGVRHWSRTGAIWPDARSQAHLSLNNPSSQHDWDGEAQLPQDTYHFQDTVRAMRGWDETLSPLTEYHVFDLVPKNEHGRTATFAERLAFLEGLFRMRGIPDTWRLVPTTLVHSQAEMLAFHEQCIEAGYEGTILRDPNAAYGYGQRVVGLQKLKDFMDDEFEIVDFEEGRASDKGTVKWICQTGPQHPKGAGLRFTVRPRGTHAERTGWFNRGSSFVGKMLTVSFEEWTKAGLPSKGIGIVVRDYE